MRALHFFRVGALLVGMIIHSAQVSAQSSPEEVLRRTQLQLRQSEQERNSLRAEISRLQTQLASQASEIEQLRKQADHVQGRQSSAVAEISAKNQKLTEASRSLREAQEEVATLRAQNVRQAQAVTNVQAMLQMEQTKRAQRDELVELCRARNLELYKVGNEILTMYRDKDFNSFTKREPVLQLQQVKLQNLTQQFEDRLRQQRVYEDTLPPSVEKAMQESLRKEAAEANGATQPPSG